MKGRVRPTFLLIAGPRRVDENPAHQPRRHGEEMRAVLPPHLSQLDQSQVRLVHERRRLQGVTASLTFHVTGGEPAQLLIDQR